MEFFENLTDIVSLPPVEHPNDTVIGLIPVFADPYFDTKSFKGYLKAAIYSRQTWLLHTDAYHENVAVQLYIDRALESEAMPLLKLNGLTEADVRWFDAPPLADTFHGVWGRLGKKLCLYWDPHLADYEKVVYWDADMFKLNEPQFADFFARAAADTDDLTFLLTFTYRRRDWRPKMIRRSTRNVGYGGIPVQDIFTRAGLGRVLQGIPGMLTRPAGGLGIFPAKHFYAHQTAFLDWLQTHGPYIGDDEYSIALGAMKFTVLLRSLRGAWGATHVDVYNYLYGTSTDPTLLHGKPVPDAEADYRNVLETLTTSV